MFVQLNSVIVDADAENRQELAAFMQDRGVNVAAQQARIEDLEALLGQPEPPQIAVINLDPDPTALLQKIGTLPRRFAKTNFFVMSTTIDPQLLMEAMALGVREFIALPVDAEKFAAAIDRASNASGSAERAKIIAVMPTIGGCGSTTIACNLAAALAQRHKTVLVDLDLVRGAVASNFDLNPRYTIADVLASSSNVDKALLENALAVHRNSGVSVLARPEQPEDSERGDAAGLRRLLDIVGRIADFVVVDAMMSWDPLHQVLFKAADAHVVTMQLNVPSAKNAERIVDAFRRQDIDLDKVKIVVNRFVKRGHDIEPAEVEKTIGLKIAWKVPNDFKNAIAAINYGEPVVMRSPRAEISQALNGLAATFVTQDKSHKQRVAG